jgi:hypothetical protein
MIQILFNPLRRAASGNPKGRRVSAHAKIRRVERLKPAMNDSEQSIIQAHA